MATLTDGCVQRDPGVLYHRSLSRYQSRLYPANRSRGSLGALVRHERPRETLPRGMLGHVTGSEAHQAFRSNRSDVDRLMELHSQISGEAPGRKYGVAVLNKSAIVLLCAAWEAYCEDIVSEVVEHYVEHAPSSDVLPKALRSRIATDLTKDKMLMWRLADDGWRSLLRSRLTELKVEHDRRLNTPKSDQIRELFREHAGCDDITSAWHWHNRSIESSRETLDRLVTLRGAIAHRVEADFSVRKGNVTYYTGFIGRLVQSCDHVMAILAKEVTGTSLGDS